VGAAQAEVVEAMAASNGYTASSLEAGIQEEEQTGDGMRRAYPEVLGAPGPALGLFEDCHALAPLPRDLNRRELRILRLGFGEEWTQQRIGDEPGCSRMHVSHQLSRIYGKLRQGLLADQR
jgi:RNA polymerase sigma-B factor